MQPVFLDANVLMEILFERQRNSAALDYIRGLKSVQLCVSVLSLDIVLYFVEAEKFSKQTAWAFLNHYRLLDMTASDAEWARDNDQGDFEDALQMACAHRHGCQQFITLDTAVEKRYGSFLPVVTIR